MRATSGIRSCQVQCETDLGRLAPDVDGVQLGGQRQLLAAGQPLLVDEGRHTLVVHLGEGQEREKREGLEGEDE